MKLSRSYHETPLPTAKRRLHRNLHPPPLTPGLALSIPQAVFPAIWLALTKGGKLDGNSLLRASTPEFPATSYTVVSIKFLLILPCFSLLNKCSIWPRACAEIVPESLYSPSFFLFQPSILAEVLKWKSPILLPHQYQICIVLCMFLPI